MLKQKTDETEKNCKHRLCGNRHEMVNHIISKLAHKEHKNKHKKVRKVILGELIGLIWFYGISSIVGYLVPNPLYRYIFNIYDLVWFYGISSIVGYLMSNPLYRYIFNIYDLVGFGFMAYQPL